ncbi:MAG TPA: alanine--tRNA ligase [Candidatus Marinimicrobia bacterium]|nr:alanine--tRNA ligase [Candidatus Neomarinimicrobiota bacterium]
MKTANDVRREFLEFFASHGHKIVRSAPVIPQSDPTLLFTNAGMNQFKGIFLGQEKIESLRVANSQKCIRVSGKHNDLEEVGKDTYHHTFFEMLGNWSFGDYYKAEAVQMAWELLTEVWKLPTERLWVTIYRDDEEALQAWQRIAGLDQNRILRFGEKDNFWEMGETGPCGPCSEIHYYTGPHPENQQAEMINSGNPEYIELWNLVFIQFDRDKSGELKPLPLKHVDTGAGLERMVAVLQGKKSNYDTDLFKPIIDRIVSLTGKEYHTENGVPHRVIADHIRMLTFAIADGGLPSNDGRGYVIRRILRRAARFGRMLEMHKPFIYQLVDSVIEVLGATYPEIAERRNHIQAVIKAEEKSFGLTLDRGLEVFAKLKENLQRNNITIIPGEEVFKLYDTFGFPMDLTRLLAEEAGFSIDEKGFENLMNRQKERARASVAFQADDFLENEHWQTLTTGDDSEFFGYENLETQSVIRKYLIEGQKVHLILDRTPFYAEAGGEVGDVGIIEGNNFRIRIDNTRKIGSSIIHSGHFEKGNSIVDPIVKACLDNVANWQIRANHTATHLLQAALRQILGEHVHQSGSLVTPEKLRFDFTHFTKMTESEIEAVEDWVNARIRENLPVNAEVKDYQSARESGAMALFGEKYGDVVRVINVGDYSKELCGGKHVNRTGDIGCFKIISETAIAAGVRRIEAITGETMLKLARENERLLEKITTLLGVNREQLPHRIEKLLTDYKNLEKQLHKNNKAEFEQEIDTLLEKAEMIGELKVFTYQANVKSLAELKEIGDLVRDKLPNGVGVIAGIIDEKPSIVVVVTDLAIKQYGLKASDIVRELGSILGGGGGGQAHLATAGGRFTDKIPEALQAVIPLIKSKIESKR